MGEMPVIYKCITVSAGMKKRYGNDLHLEAGKAKRLERKGLIRIIGEYKTERSKETKNKYKTKHRKRVNQQVEGKPLGKLKIPIIIPYAGQGRIGQAYNEAMIDYVNDWVIFIDHDVLIMNPHWYEICVNAIEQCGHSVGWFTCFTNRIGCRFQKAPRINKKTDDIKYHRDYAKKLYNENKGKIKDLTHARGGRFSGMFILTHKKAWADCGGFNENIGFFNVDCRYFTALKQAGYRVCRMDDLYVYHSYFREVLKPYFKKGEQ